MMNDEASSAPDLFHRQNESPNIAVVQPPPMVPGMPSIHLNQVHHASVQGLSLDAATQHFFPLLQTFGVRLSPVPWTAADRLMGPANMCYTILRHIEEEKKAGIMAQYENDRLEAQEKGLASPDIPTFESLTIADIFLPVPEEWITTRWALTEKNGWQPKEINLTCQYYSDMCTEFRLKCEAVMAITDMVANDPKYRMARWNTVREYWKEQSEFTGINWSFNPQLSRNEAVRLSIECMTKYYKKHGDMKLLIKRKLHPLYMLKDVIAPLLDQQCSLVPGVLGNKVCSNTKEGEDTLCKAIAKYFEITSAEPASPNTTNQLLVEHARLHWPKSFFDEEDDMAISDQVLHSLTLYVTHSWIASERDKKNKDDKDAANEDPGLDESLDNDLVLDLFAKGDLENLFVETTSLVDKADNFGDFSDDPTLIDENEDNDSAMQPMPMLVRRKENPQPQPMPPKENESNKIDGTVRPKRGGRIDYTDKCASRPKRAKRSRTTQAFDLHPMPNKKRKRPPSKRTQKTKAAPTKRTQTNKAADPSATIPSWRKNLREPVAGLAAMNLLLSTNDTEPSTLDILRLDKESQEKYFSFQKELATLVLDPKEHTDPKEFNNFTGKAQYMQQLLSELWFLVKDTAEKAHEPANDDDSLLSTDDEDSDSVDGSGSLASESESEEEPEEEESELNHIPPALLQTNASGEPQMLNPGKDWMNDATQKVLGIKEFVDSFMACGGPPPQFDSPTTATYQRAMVSCGFHCEETMGNVNDLYEDYISLGLHTWLLPSYFPTFKNYLCAFYELLTVSEINMEPKTAELLAKMWDRDPLVTKLEGKAFKIHIDALIEDSSLRADDMREIVKHIRKKHNDEIDNNTFGVCHGGTEV